MFAKVPRTSGSEDSRDTTPAWRGTVAMERMERAGRNRVRKQAGAMLLVPLLCVLIMVGRVFMKPAVYAATGSVRLVPSSLQAAPPPGLPPGYTYYGVNAIRPHDRTDELQILTSSTFLHRVAAQLPREEQRRLLQDSPDDYTPTALQDALVAELADGLAIEDNNRNELFEISFVHPDRYLATSIVKQIMDAAALVGLHLGEERNRRAATFFAGQILSLKDQIRAAQDRENVIEQGGDLLRRQAQRNAGGAYVFEVGSDTDPELGLLMTASTQARLDEKLARGEVRLLEALGKDDSTATEAVPELEQLRSDMHRAEAEYAALGATLGANQPQMLARAAMLARYRQELSVAAARRLQAAHALAAQAGFHARALEAETARHLQALKAVQKEEVHDAMLEIDLALNLSVYEGIKARLQVSRINAGLGATDLQVVDEPFVPDRPEPRKIAVPVLIGMVGGILLGGLVVIYLAQGGMRGWSVDQMEINLQLPALTVLSQQKPGWMGHADGSLPSDFEDGLRILESELLLLPAQMGSKRRARVLMFTSAVPSEGKTSAICSYARMRAREGRRVLLVDADLHRPSVHRFFGLSGRLGVSNVLQGRSAFADAVQRPDSEPGLAVLVAGPVPPSPSDLLSRRGFVEMVEQAAQQYDEILIDSPPVLALMDSVTMSLSADVVLLVARYGRVTLADAKRARETLVRAGAPLGGLVVNGAPAA